MPDAESLLARDHRELDAFSTEAFAAFTRGDAAAAHVALDRLWMRLAVHIRAEHKVLFPALGGAPPEIQALIQELKGEHDVFMTALARFLQDLRKPEADLPPIAAAFTDMHDLLQAHNHREEIQVYPIAGAADGLTIRINQELTFLPERYRK